MERLETRRLLATVSLDAVRDATLIEDAAGALANGSGDYLFAGRTGQPQGQSIRRALLSFDLAGASIPAGAAVTQVTLQLFMSRTISGPQQLTLHRVTQSWVEGASNPPGQEGSGTAAMPGDTTWTQREFGSTAWASSGGSFQQQASAITTVSGEGVYQWSSSGLIADVQHWLANPGENFGWLLRDSEQSASTAKRFNSRENPNQDSRPKLVIEYTEPASVTVDVGPTSIAEGNQGTTTLRFEVTLSATPSAEVRVQFTLQDGTATSGIDYQSQSGTLVFPVGGATTQFVDIVVLGDTEVEPDETLTFVLSNPVNAVLGNATAIGTILNDDAPPVITISAADAEATEGNAGTAALTFTLTLSGPSTQEIRVEYTTADLTATAGSDYQSASGTLTFPAGVTSRTVDVTIFGDTKVEPDETFQLLLTNATGAAIQDGSAVGTILNDDEPANPFPWHNAELPEDVTQDGAVTVEDARAVIEAINSEGARFLPVPPTAGQGPPPFLDVTGDNRLSVLDALFVINYINFGPGSSLQRTQFGSSRNHATLRFAAAAATLAGWADSDGDDLFSMPGLKLGAPEA